MAVEATKILDVVAKKVNTNNNIQVVSKTIMDKIANLGRTIHNNIRWVKKAKASNLCQ